MKLLEYKKKKYGNKLVDLSKLKKEFKRKLEKTVFRV